MSDAVGAQIATVFDTLVLQPTTLCNLDCAYCYLPLRKRNTLMGVNVAAACAASVAAQASGRPVDVVWHAGEPLATPIGYLRTLLAEFEDLRRGGAVRHVVQTNATLLTPAWCDLLATYGFDVGVSLDGPSGADGARVDWRGEGAHERILRGLAELRTAGLPFSVICVVTADTIDDPDSLVDFFDALGATSVGFNIEEHEGVNTARPGPTVAQAERFWARLWQRREAGLHVRIRDLERFAGWLHTARTGRAGAVALDPIPTVAHNGDVVMLSPELAGIRDARYHDFIIGNVVDRPLPALLAAAAANADGYVAEFVDGLHACAAACEFWAFCQGAQAGNRYFEHGTFAATETNYCRTSRQALVRAAAAHLGERR